MAKKKHVEHESHERWLVSYADFITLLFAFFVVLYATSNQNIEKEKKFEESVRQEFKMSGTGPAQQGTSGSIGNPASLDQPIDLLQAPRLANEDLQDQVEDLLDKSLSKEEKSKTITSIRHDSIGVRIALAAGTFFPSGSTKLRIPALKTLDKVAQILKKTNRSLIIEGHTDSDQVLGGQFESNWELASLRATTVVRYLIKVHQIDSKKLSAISYADQKPLVPNSSEENKSKNRRIELLIVNSD